jgi:TRAP-type C4-dicarboxylate transport system permease large subunit
MAVIPFYIPLIIVLLLITYVPTLTLWLPNLVLGPD